MNGAFRGATGIGLRWSGNSESARNALLRLMTRQLYYDRRFHTWNRNRYGYGLQTTLNRRVMIDAYYMRRTTAAQVAPHVNAIGADSIFFSVTEVLRKQNAETGAHSSWRQLAEQPGHNPI